MILYQTHSHALLKFNIAKPAGDVRVFAPSKIIII